MTSTISRFYDDLGSFLVPNKVLVLFGARRVGKTTLLRNYLKNCGFKHRLDSGDNIATQELLGSQDFKRILGYAEGYELIVIDEAQNIPNIGMGLKILVDEVPGIRIMATGSSSFNLASSVGEPLTGRKTTLTLYPIAQLELAKQFNRQELKSHLEDYLLFGGYPEILTTPAKADKIDLLKELVDSYILRDILALERVKGAKPLLDLLKLLAFQIGQLVSHNELATQLKMDAKTVGRYLDLLEKAFVIFPLGGLSRNLRNEVISKQKYYFYDTGLRNAIISQFNSLDLRQDVGGLWENFVVSERLKKNSYHRFYGNRYFWRTYEGKEIDYVEEVEGQLKGFECKWSADQRVKAPAEWLEYYPGSGFEVLNSENYLDFVLGQKLAPLASN